MDMNTLLAVLAVVGLCAAPAAAQGRDGHGGGGGGGRGGRGGGAAHAAPARPRAPQPMRYSPGVRVRPTDQRRPPAAHFDLHPAPAPVVQGGGARLDQHGDQRGGFAGRVDSRGWGAPRHDNVANQSGFAGRAFAREKDEHEVNHVYWHNDGNQRYAHSYDGHVHWYGFYNGPRFYWTRWEDNRWWWFDQASTRWLYWYSGYWWWNDPANPTSPYVVVNDTYYPYAEVAADPQIAPGAAPADSSSAMAAADTAAKGQHGNFAKVSPDGSREVQVYGDRREAFLYDRTGGEPRFIAFLAASVKHVQFSEASGNQLQVLLLLLDGTYDVFDANGRSLIQPGGQNGAPTTPAVPGADAVPAAPAAPTDASGPNGAPPQSAPPQSTPPIPGQ